ncbi:MAG: hypothetical protein KAJ39_02055 [Gammaproteobacteria bacterium]|nr:hypothetical protein [Gammaproteobacteria bacterium]
MTLYDVFLPTVDSEYKSNIASKAVESGLDKYSKYGDESLATAFRFIEELAKVTDGLSDIPQLNEELGEVLSKVSSYNAPTKPIEPEIVPQFSQAPLAPVLQDVAEININQDAPTFDKADPNIRDIAAPNKFTKSAPLAPELQAHALPNTRELIIPDTPTSRDIVLPDNVELMKFAFEGTEPGVLKDAPDVSFNYAENKYTSTLKEKLDAKLLEYVDQNITGIDPVIEEQIWNASRERVSAVMQGRIKQSKRLLSASGWQQPIGAQVANTNKATQAAADEKNVESRNIAVEQAKLIQQKFHQSLAMAIQLETVLVGHNDSYAQRGLEASKYTVQAAIDLHGLLITQFNSAAQVYETYSRVFKTRVDADIARLEQQRVQLEAQKLIGELNQQDVDKFKVEVEVQALIQKIVNDELEAVKIKLEQDRLTIQNYEGKTRGFEAEIKAKSLEYEGYRDEQQGELLKATTHETLAKIYDTKMKGYETLANTQIAIQESDIKIKQELPLEVTKVLSQIFETTNSGEESRIKALTDLYNVRSDVYDTEVKGESSRVDSEVKVQEQEIKKLVAESEVRIQSLKGNIASMLASIELALESSKAGTQSAAQLSAAALSTVSVNATVTETASNSTNNTTGLSIGNKTSHNHSKTYND